MADKLATAALGLVLAATATWGQASALMLEPVPELRVLSTHFPPYVMESGKAVPGPLARLALEAVARSGRVGRAEFVPWPRAQAVARRDSDALIIPLVRSPEREPLYQWIGVLHCRSMGYVALRNHLPGFDDASLAAARVVVLRAAPHAAGLKALSVQEATSFEDMAKMLHLGMADALYGNQETILLALAARGIARPALATSAPLESDPLWLAASPSLPKATVEELRQSLTSLQKDGTMARILEQGALSRASCAAP